MEGTGDGVSLLVGAIPDGPSLACGGTARLRGRVGPDANGLDHLAFAAGSSAKVSGWEQRFVELDVPHDPTQVTGYGHVVNFEDPDGMALEIFAAPGS